MTRGLVASLRHQEVARLSFLLIFTAGGVLEVPQLASRPSQLPVSVAAAHRGWRAAAYLSARFLIR